MITFETSSDNYQIIEASGILECKGVTEKTAKRKNKKITDLVKPMGVSGEILLSPEMIQLYITAGNVIDKLLQIVLEFIKRKKQFTIKIGGKEMEFTNYSEAEIRKILAVALQGT